MVLVLVLVLVLEISAYLAVRVMEQNYWEQPLLLSARSTEARRASDPNFPRTGVADSLNKPSASMTIQGGNRAQVLKFEPAIPDRTAPPRNAHQMLASIRARAR